MFYSRRIGLDQGRVVPIIAGGRLTGRLSRFTLGMLNIQSDTEPVSTAPTTNFSVLRVRRDLLRRSNIGVLFTRRSADRGGVGTSEAYGVDGTFAFFEDLTINTYWARTHTDDLAGEDTSYRGQLDYAGDRYGVQLERLVVGDHVNPSVGFVRRDDMRRSFGLFRFSPRPQSITSVRKFSWTGSLDYIENSHGRLETRERDAEFGIEFQNSDKFTVGHAGTYEFLPRPFNISSGVTLPVGGYNYASPGTGFNFGQQRPVSGNLLIEGNRWPELAGVRAGHCPQSPFGGGITTTVGASFFTALRLKRVLIVNRRKTSRQTRAHARKCHCRNVRTDRGPDIDYDLGDRGIHEIPRSRHVLSSIPADSSNHRNSYKACGPRTRRAGCTRMARNSSSTLSTAMPIAETEAAGSKIGDSVLKLGASMEGWPARGLVARIYVEDSDALFNKAVNAGATVIMPMTDMFFGSREGRVADPHGNVWTIATLREEVSPEEMQRRTKGHGY